MTIRLPRPHRHRRPDRPGPAARQLTVLAATIALMVTAVAPAAADDDEEDDGDALAGVRDVVVKLDPAAGATVDAINAEYGTRTLDTLMGSAGIHLLGLPEGADVAATAEALDADPRLLYAEPNFAQQAPETISRWRTAWTDGEPTATGADRYTGQYAVRRLGLAQAHGTSRGAGVVVAVLDAGFQLDHAVLAGRFAGGGYDVVDDDADPAEAPNGRDDDGDGVVDEGYGHGTHVAGLVLLAAPDARILPMRVLDSDGSGNVFTTAEAVLRARAAGADVISMSFGSAAPSNLMDEVGSDAEEGGVVLVGAAGNLASDQPQYPAADEDTIAVTATDATDALTGFANHGSWVDLAAPGDDVVSAIPPAGYAEWDGTSMAAPLVAGGAALVLAVAPRSPEAVTDLLRSTAAPVVGVPGLGRVDLAAAVRAAAGSTGDGDGDGDDDGEDGDD